MLKRVLVVGAATLVASTPIQAQEEETPKGLQKMIDEGAVTIEKRFDTPSDEIQGFVLQESNGEHVVVYGMDEHVIGGVLISPEGENLTSKYVEQHVPKPDLTETAEPVINSDHLITEGPDDAPEVYVFTDANCPYCTKIYEMSRDAVANGDVQIHWVMVSILKSTSDFFAAMSMEEGAETMGWIKTTDQSKSVDRNNLESFMEEAPGDFSDSQIDGKGIPEKYATAIADHNAAMQDLDITGTPGFLYKVDGSWEAQSGAPSNKAFQNLIESIDSE